MKMLVHFALWQLGFAEAQTQTTESERNCLARWAVNRHRIAEIGVWHAVTTQRLRQAMAPDGIVFAVDPYPRGRLGFSTQRYIALRSMHRIEKGDIRWIRTTGVEAARILCAENQAPVDFVFIDGDHSYEGLSGDWEAWSGLVAPCGIVALHDSRSTADRNIDSAGSVQFTHAVILKDSRFEVVETVDSLTVLMRSAEACAIPSRSEHNILCL
jgi:predicted O-methyltransferase YrrM